MIFGIGTDIIEIERIEKAVKNEGFLKKYFTSKEIELFDKKNVQSIAGNFCVKEAVSKALGTGFRGFSPIDIEVLRNKLGNPYVLLYNKALDISNKNNIYKIFVSISHCKKYATGMAVLEKRE